MVEDEFRVTVVSHSLVHQRQFMFFQWMQSHKEQFDNLKVQEIYPSQWGSQYRLGGFGTTGSGMADYVFDEHACRAIAKFRPSILYCQQEAYCMVTRQLWLMQKEFLPKTAFVLFVWENLENPGYKEDWVKEIIEKADGFASGSSAAKGLLGREAEIMPQVGVNCDQFFPFNSSPQRQFDLIFAGRQAENKGWLVIEKMKELHPEFKLFRVVNASYSDMAGYYNRAKVDVSPVIDTPSWCEQWLSFEICEALACGLRAVKSKTAAVMDYVGSGIPGLYLCQQNSQKSLYEQTAKALDGWKVNDEGREWVLRNLSYPIIAQKTYNLWKKSLEK